MMMANQSTFICYKKHIYVASSRKKLGMEQPFEAISFVSFWLYVWQEQDVRLPASRPSSAPTEPNAKAARKASKKLREEAK